MGNWVSLQLDTAGDGQEHASKLSHLRDKEAVYPSYGSMVEGVPRGSTAWHTWLAQCMNKSASVASESPQASRGFRMHRSRMPLGGIFVSCCHKLSGLKQCKFVILQICRIEDRCLNSMHLSDHSAVATSPTKAEKGLCL